MKTASYSIYLILLLLVTFAITNVGSIQIHSVLLTTPLRLELSRIPDTLNGEPHRVPMKPASTIERSVVEDILARIKAIEEKIGRVQVKKSVSIWEGIVGVKNLIMFCMLNVYINFLSTLPFIGILLLVATPMVDIFLFVLLKSLLRSVHTVKR